MTVFRMHTKKRNYEKLKKDILASITGDVQDYTAIDVRRAILLLSIPMFLEMLMESVFAVVDIFFVSKLGADAIATVGITESLLTIVYAMSSGLGMGVAAMVSRRIGEKNDQEASKTAFQAVVVSLLISFIITFLGAYYASGLLKLMGAEKNVYESGYMYTAILLGSNGLIILLFVMNAIYRSAGHAVISMRILWIANILNIILDPCFIFGLGPFPRMGIVGAAVATVIARGAAVIYQFYLLFNGNKRIRFIVRELVIDIGIIKRLVTISLGGIGQQIIANSSLIGLVRIIAIFGSDVLAGYTIAIRIILFSLLPSWGLCNAAATLVGQNLGANQPKRAEQSVWISGYANMIILGIAAFFFVLYPKFFITLFSEDKHVIVSGAVCLQLISLGYIIYAMGMVAIQALNGAGDTTTPIIINFFCFWLLEIPLAYILAVGLHMEEKGVFLSIIIAESLVSIAGILIFKKGKWKIKKV